MSNLQRRSNGIYYFRLRLPADLSRWFPERGEIRKSLKTKDRRNARLHSARHSEQAEKTFALIRSGLMTDGEIKRLVDEYLRDTLAKNDMFRLEIAPSLDHDESTGAVVGSAAPYAQWAEEPLKVLEGKSSPEMERILKKVPTVAYSNYFI